MADKQTEGTVAIKVEFSGGLESLFQNRRSHLVQVPKLSMEKQPTIADLITHLAQQFLSKSPKRSLFVQDEQSRSVRPGILVLINDADWELEGEAECKLKSGDEVCFVSTLHGG
ncbi:MAG: Ubiquitin- modifier 1 [Chrysothrix sp. TS-e1954]|nr:MAG: Ubiquitin- modifier 1 [Chrysothrix sp. TS-e1954]